MFSFRRDMFMFVLQRRVEPGAPFFKLTTNLFRKPITGASHQKKVGARITPRSYDSWTDIKRRHVWLYLGRKAWYIRADYTV